MEHLATASFAQANAQRPSGDGRISWEIANRFSPFETLHDPAEMFDNYASEVSQDMITWQKRLRHRLISASIPSPYSVGAVQRYERPKPDEDVDTLPWDLAQELHRPEVLRFIRGETDPNTTIAVRVSMPNEQRDCIWHLDNTPVSSVAPCRDVFQIDLPFPGATVRADLLSTVGNTVDEQVSEFLKPDHLVIVGMGDSYGSGEGNPDAPTVWSPMNQPSANDLRYLAAEDTPERKRSARWLDEKCHRSFFSNQSLTAFALAARDPHRVVSFLHYACTGASVFDGLLTQQLAPGRYDDLLRSSQLQRAIAELCDKGALEAADDLPREVTLDVNLNLFGVLGRGGNYDVVKQASKAPCQAGKLRAPDLVLVSIGGNDVGFSSIISYALLPTDFGDFPLAAEKLQSSLPDVCPPLEQRYSMAEDSGGHMAAHCHKRDRQLGFDAGDLIGISQDEYGMSSRLGIAYRAISHYLEIDPERIIAPLYPDPVRFVTPTTENQCSDAPSLGRASLPMSYTDRMHWQALRATDPIGITASWNFGATKREAERMLATINALRREMLDAGSDSEISIVCATRDTFVNRGWWQGTLQDMPSLRTQLGNTSKWRPYRYESDGRALITANDAYRTQNSSGENLPRTFGRPTGDYHGTIHPNLYGHLLITNEVLEYLREEIDLSSDED